MDLIKLSQPQNVGAGNTATLVTEELIGKSVTALLFKRGGTFTAANMTNIQVRVDGKNLLEGVTGTQVQNLNSYDGLSAPSNHLFHHFGDPTARTVRGQHLGDVDMSIYRAPMEINVDIAAGATSPTLEIYALTGVPKIQMGIGYDETAARQLRALIRTQISLSAAVTRQQHNVSIGSNPGGRIRKVAFFHGGNLSSVEYKKQSLEKWDDISQTDNDVFNVEFGRVAVSNLYVLDRIADGNQGEAEDTLSPEGRRWVQTLAFTSSAADTINAFADMHIPYELI